MASTYLSRTPASAGDRRTFTISTWFKISDIDTWSAIISAGSSGNDHTELTFNAGAGNDADIEFKHYNGSSFDIQLATNRVFRDVNAWYHIVIEVDTTQATSSDRVKMYINGVQETSFAASTYPSLNFQTNFNNTNIHTVGRGTQSGTASTRVYWDGSLTHFHLIDGTAYDADTFGETDATTGIWKPKTAPSVTYGTNGFFLKFENSGAFGTDSSGNGNTFTVNGTMTQTLDTPSNVFATLNPLAQTTTKGTLSNGNLTYDRPGSTSSWVAVAGSLSFTKGKYYWEYKVIDAGTPSQGCSLGYINYDIHSFQNSSSSDLNATGAVTWYSGGGNIFSGGTNLDTYNSYTDGDILMFGIDADNGFLYFGKNGTWENSADPESGATGTGGIAISNLGSNGTYSCGMAHREDGNGQANFGNGYFGTTAVSSAQNPDDGIGIFEYDVPAGYRALCTKSINAEEYS